MQAPLRRCAACSCPSLAGPGTAGRSLSLAQRATLVGPRWASTSSSSSASSASPTSSSNSSSARRLLYLSTIASSFGLLLYLTDSTSAASSLLGFSKSSTLEEYTYAAFPILSARRSVTSQEEAPSEKGGGVGDGQHAYLRVKLPKPSSQGAAADDSLASRLGIWSVYVKQPDLQIERPYTPLRSAPLGKGPGGKSPEAGSDDELELLVKRYPHGEVGRWLYNLRPGQDVELRGPSQTWKASEDLANSLQEIVFIAGGTGITPAYQLLTNLLGDPPGTSSSPDTPPSPAPRFKLLYAAPSPSSLLLLPELSALQSAHPERVDVRLFVENDVTPGGAPALAISTSQASPDASRRGWLGRLNPFGTSRAQSEQQQQLVGLSAKQGRIAKGDISVALADTKSGGRIVLLCGPDGMVEAFAGPRARDGRGQGELRGVLAQLGLQKEEVFKL